MGEEDCCSKKEVEGTCACAGPGFPSRPHMNGAECCANYTKDGHCGCYGPSHRLTVEQSTHHCCGGLHNISTHQCKCVPEGYAIASYVKGTSCCGENVDSI